MSYTWNNSFLLKLILKAFFHKYCFVWNIIFLQHDDRILKSNFVIKNFTLPPL